ncbi:MAG TPA: dihydropteroate synthase, partial [Flavobacteriales bacterium]|nr:dihydropteroate synthase [Flavobacteriales bacterium]
MRREDTFFKRTYTMTINGQLVQINKPLVMGIVNATPDSFNPKSRVNSPFEACQLAEKQLKEGADWIDVGAMSSRPGADVLPESEEELRLLPVIKAMVKSFPNAVFSVDTWRASLVKKAVNEGAALVNDITGGFGDPAMVQTVATLGVPYIAMHSRGNALTMQTLTQYEKLPDDIIQWFFNRLKIYHEAGIQDVIVDPGIGFAKTAEQNFLLIETLHEFKVLEKLLLIGISKKSFISKSL